MKSSFRTIVVLAMALLCQWSLQAQWVQCTLLPNQGVSTQLFYVVASGSRIFTTHTEANDSVFYSDDNGTSWQISKLPGVTTGGITQYPYIKGLWNINGTIFASGGLGRQFMWRSSDNGNTWDTSSTGLTARANVLYAKGNIMYAGTNLGGMFLSTNNGLTWAAANSGLPSYPFGIPATAFVNALAIAGIGNDVFIGLNGDISGHTYGVWHTTVGGSTWDSLGTGLPAHVSAPALLADGDTLYTRVAYSAQGVYKSSDLGAHWTNVTNGIVRWGNLGDGSQGFFKVGSSIFVGSASGEYSTTNGGTSWALIDQTGLPLIYSITGYAQMGNTLFITLQNLSVSPPLSAVWKRNISEISSVREIPGQTPAEFKLSQNYPNPFNPATTIRYDIVKQEHVKLEIVNVLGEVVATLVDQDQHVGTYNATWNATSHSSGVFFSRLTAGSQVSTSRMVLLK